MGFNIFKYIGSRILGLYVDEVKGIENIPKKGAVILASNQESNFDPLITAYLPLRKFRMVHYLTRFEFDNIKRVNRIFLKITKPFFIMWLGAIPITKKGKVIPLCVKYLKKNKVLGLFPEGKRNTEKTLLKGHTGVARIALLAKVPVIPVGLKNTSKILSKGNMLPRFRRASVSFGEPLFFDEYYGRENDRKVLRKITDIIMKEIAKLSGKRYDPGAE